MYHIIKLNGYNNDKNLWIWFSNKLYYNIKEILDKTTLSNNKKQTHQLFLEVGEEA